ncbi:hypothetical protein GQ43DRAFT_444559 [Delitschia confertaspora ATCC 74209]|uniref:Uncharacterized protein n=1 Tax=Delitschia confertaspora ATCC 74209 TaxID=1513339 RepID=A0A9P4MUH6_9PLEO|nr:hypothetical protein GQ43DRAFT_444559 [Delitschia confertaspora ATCC 74209]
MLMAFRTRITLLLHSPGCVVDYAVKLKPESTMDQAWHRLRPLPGGIYQSRGTTQFGPVEKFHCNLGRIRAL